MTPVKQEIAVFRLADGVLMHTAPAHLRPTSPEFSFTPLPSGFDEAYWEWSSSNRSFRENLQRLETYLIDAIKRQAEQKKMEVLTPGGAKKKEYANKQAEVIAFDGLVRSVVGDVAAALPLTAMGIASVLTAFDKDPTRAMKFRHAISSSRRHGDTVRHAIERFRKGIEQPVAATEEDISAEEEYICGEIRRAATAAGKRAAAAKLKWPGA